MRASKSFWSLCLLLRSPWSVNSSERKRGPSWHRPQASGCWKHLLHLAEVHLKTSPKVDWQLLGGTKSATQGNPCRMFSSFSTKHHLYNVTLKFLSFTIQRLEPETTMPFAVKQMKQILNCVASNFLNLEMLFCSLSSSTICFIIVVTFIS